MSAYRILLSTYSSTAAQGLPSRALAFSSGGEPGSQFRSSARGTPPGFSCRARAGCRRAGFSRCSARTELPRAGIRDLPEPGIDLLSSALAGGFLVTGPPPAYHIRYWKLPQAGMLEGQASGTTIYPCIKHSLEALLCFAGLNPQRSKKSKDFIFSGLCKSCCCGRFVSSGSFSFAWSQASFLTW